MSYFRVMNGKGEVAEFDYADAATNFYCQNRACGGCPMRMREHRDQKSRCIITAPCPDNWKELANERDPDGFQIKPEIVAGAAPENLQRAISTAKEWAKEHPEQVNDPVNHPAHYTAGGIECIDAIAAALTCQKDPMQAWLTGQVLKYLWRWPLKNGKEDLEKARWYLDRLIEKLEAKKE